MARARIDRRSRSATRRGDRAPGSETERDDYADERRLRCLADGAAVGLDALRKVLALRLGQPAPSTALDEAPRFVVIESAQARVC